MPFDGSGNFSPSPAPNFPAVPVATISSTYYNAVINDIATGLSNVITRDGQGKPSANIDWNNKNLSGVATLTAVSLVLTNAVGVAAGGTGLTTVPTDGKLLIGSTAGAGYVLATLTAGAGITVTNGAGSITIASTVTGMTYPGAGIAVSTGAAWGTSKATPAGVIVGDTDAQTLSSKTLTSPIINGGTVNFAASPVATNPGPLGMNQISVTSNRTLAATDFGANLYITGTTAAQAITMPANGTTPIPAEFWCQVTNDSNQNWNIACTTDVLFWSPSGGTGTRILAAGGTAMLRKVTTTRTWVTGTGLT